MKANAKFERAARINRAKAMFFTIIFHFGLVAGIAFYNDLSFEQYIPEKVKTLIGMEEAQESLPAVKERVLP